jgi:hypothetical protein
MNQFGKKIANQEFQLQSVLNLKGTRHRGGSFNSLYSAFEKSSTTEAHGCTDIRTHHISRNASTWSVKIRQPVL